MLERMKRRGRPKKKLPALVADRSFLARRHGELLAGPPVDDPTLAALQQLYRQAGDDRQRRRVALQFEKLCRAAPPAVVGEPDVAPDVEAAETQPEIMARVWRQPAPWRERGVSTEEAHSHSNVPWVPGSWSNPHSWPPLEPPTGEG